MSRSGYSEDAEYLALYRANVDRAIRGKRGQKFLLELAASLDAMPVKELIDGDVVRDNEHVCALGSVAVARKLDVSGLDIYDGDDVGKAFGIAPNMACEIAYQNDERGPWREKETPAERWTRMRAWVDGNLRKVPASSTDREG